MSTAFPAAPLVSVVIPTFNRVAALQRLLEALETVQRPPGGLEVMVVDDGSTDDTAAMANRMGARYLRQDNAGPAAARDRGWRAAAGSAIVFLDDDCIPEEAAIVRIVEGLAAADVVGARIQPLASAPLIADFVDAEGLVTHHVDPDGHVRWFVTAALAVRRTALELVDGFDLAFRSGEDVDLTIRLLEAGCTLTIEPAAIVRHDNCTSLGRLARMYRTRGGAVPRLAAKHPHYVADTRASAARYLDPRAWVEEYRRYRGQASSWRSLAFLGLRAGMVLPYAVGAIGGRRAQTGHAIRDDLRRLVQAPRVLDNWPAVIWRVAGERVGKHHRDVMAVTRAGSVIHAAPHGLSRAAIFQVFADDEYLLADYAAIRGSSPTTIVDVGGHIGAFTVAVCERLARATVITYEPSPTSLHYLRRNVAENGLSGRVTVIPKAVTSTGGPVQLFEASDASCVTSTVAATAPTGAATSTVETESFADLTAHVAGRIDLLKIDCEGREYDIVEGSSVAAWQDVDRVVLEYHDVPGHSWEQLRAALIERGFRVLKEPSPPARRGIAVVERREPVRPIPSAADSGRA